jgi:hypothetical protein
MLCHFSSRHLSILLHMNSRRVPRGSAHLKVMCNQRRSVHWRWRGLFIPYNARKLVKCPLLVELMTLRVAFWSTNRPILCNSTNWGLVQGVGGVASNLVLIKGSTPPNHSQIKKKNNYTPRTYWYKKNILSVTCTIRATSSDRSV